MLSDIEKLCLFDKRRKETIDLLSCNQIDKNTFLDSNYEYIKKLNLRPFSKVTSVLEGIYNYQYYNIFAKKSNDEANKIKNLVKKKKKYNSLINDRENYYYLKDKASSSLLKIINYNNVESYYIRLMSKRLTGEIFEIVLLDYEKVILHSKSKEILKDLKDNNVFEDCIKESLIDDYVNKSY